MGVPSVLRTDELEAVRRRLNGVLRSDDAVRLLATVDMLRAALEEIRWMSGPTTAGRARNVAKHALNP